MKEKQTYRRFDPLAFLAILGCIGMLIFECIFIFELYDRAPSQVADLLPVQEKAVVIQTNAPAVRQPDMSVPAPVATNAAPAPAEPAAPAGSVKPAALPVG